MKVHIKPASVAVNQKCSHEDPPSSWILYSWFRASWPYINKIQRDATVCRYLFTASLLYMFRVSITPIIRSTKHCNCSLWYRSYCKV